MSKKSNAGIYRLVNKVTGHYYIGHSTILANRRACHASKIRKGLHWNRHITRLAEEHGADSFAFEIMTTVPEGDPAEVKAQLERMEQDRITASYSDPMCLNICKSVERGRLGVKNTSEHKRKIGESVRKAWAARRAAKAGAVAKQGTQAYNLPVHYVDLGQRGNTLRLSPVA